MKKLCLLVLLCLPWGAFAQGNLLQSGPMVGYSTMREVLLWAQTKRDAVVHFEYWEEGKPKERKQTEMAHTNKEEGHVARLIADEVLPGKKYKYELFINGRKVERPYELSFQTQTLWQWRTDPPAVTFAFGSCVFVSEERFDRPGDPYGGGYSIFEEILKKQPDFMLWGGDNVYLREADWNSKTGILHRYTHTRSLPEMQALLGSVHNYAIWDDHDYGTNNSDRSYWNKQLTEEAFKLFWGNPNYGLAHNGQGITGTFQWSDIQFFLLDNRYFRTPNTRLTSNRYILGEKQVEWLIDNLKNSEASFKFVVVGGQFLNPTAEKENHATFAEERRFILDRIRAEKIEGVIFLTGDRHHTVLSKYQESKSLPALYDLTVSPLTSGTHEPHDENTLMVEGTLVDARNFAIMKVEGKTDNRVLTVEIYNQLGKKIWEKKIGEEDLRYQE